MLGVSRRARWTGDKRKRTLMATDTLFAETKLTRTNMSLRRTVPRWLPKGESSKAFLRTGRVSCRSKRRKSIWIVKDKGRGTKGRQLECHEAEGKVVGKKEELDWGQRVLEAEKEWEEVMELRAKEANAATPANGEGAPAFTCVSYAEAQKYFDAHDFSHVEESIVTSSGQFNSRTLLAGLQSCFRNSPESLALEREKRQAFCLSKTAFCNNNEMHIRVLLSVYAQLTGSRHSVPRYGQHWDDIGFQGNDPATDLRGAGMLGLLQLLHAVDQHAARVAPIWRLSRDDVYGYPFAIVSLNATAWSLEALRAGKLARAVVRLGSVTKALNAFHMGALLEFFVKWKGGAKTMMESGYMLTEVERNIRRNPWRTVCQGKSSP